MSILHRFNPAFHDDPVNVFAEDAPPAALAGTAPLVAEATAPDLPTARLHLSAHSALTVARLDRSHDRMHRLMQPAAPLPADQRLARARDRMAPLLRGTDDAAGDDADVPETYQLFSFRLGTSLLPLVRKHRLCPHLCEAQVADTQRRIALARAALERPPEPKPSALQWLGLQAMNLILVVAAPPVGLAVMAHALLRGPDLRITARSATLTGLAMASAANLGLHLPGLL